MPETKQAPVTRREYADRLYAGGMRCNCDLDNWEPERSTGHSWVCRIHERVMEDFRHGPPAPATSPDAVPNTRPATGE